MTCERTPLLTPTERLEALVRLAMEAWDAETGARLYPLQRETLRTHYEAALRERMAQAAQTWTCEVGS